MVCSVYPPVGRMALSALKCDDLAEDERYLHKDYRVDCSISEYIPLQVIGSLFVVLWPVGAILFLLGLMRYYKVPELAKRKMQKAELRSFIRHAIANTHKLKTELDPSITEDCVLQDLSDSALRTLVWAASSVVTGYKPSLKPADKIFMSLLLKFAGTTEVTPVPIEHRDRQELLDLLASTLSHLRQAEILVVPLVLWNGSEGEDEVEVIESLGLLVVAYKGTFLSLAF